MAKIGLPKGSGKRLKVREKSVKSQGILKWILSGNPALYVKQPAVSFLGQMSATLERHQEPHHKTRTQHRHLPFPNPHNRNNNTM